jgi:DNA-binding HxlR family transcriptional regulator
MTRRTFDQYCPIARALDVVAERWSLLIVRELVLGPKRDTDLRRARPGMWTNLLADRLRQLESAGVVRRRELPPPAARTVYELTERGHQLESVLLALGIWGIPFLDGEGGEVPLSTAVLVGLRAFFRPESTLDADERYELRIGAEELTAVVHHGQLEFRPGTPGTPAATLEADPQALIDLRTGRLGLRAAREKGLIRFEGPPTGVRRLRRAFALEAKPATFTDGPRPVAR